ncbi:MAG: tetratricopeptide repeat protein [Fuerstiella sp.]
MRITLSLIFLISTVGCGSKSNDAESSSPGVALSIGSPAAGTADSAADEKIPLADSLKNPVVEQLIQKARTAVVNGKHSAAIEALSQAIGFDAGDARLFRMRGDVYGLMGEYANARADFSLAIQAEPQNADLYNVRGYFLMTHGATGDAVADFDKAVELQPNLAVAWNNRGLVHLADSDFAAAEADFNKAVEIDPEYADALNNRGFARMKQGHLETALADLKQTIRQRPDYATAWNNTGLVYLQQENYEKAAEAFSEAVRLAPLDVRWLNHRRSALLKLERFEEASADTRRLNWLSTLSQLTIAANADSRNPQVWLQRATHLMNGAEYQAAVQDFTRALTVSPGNADALNGRATAWLKMGDLKQAIADCDESLVLQPSTTAYSVRGDAWFALKNLDQAIADFEAARRFDDTVAEAYLQRSTVHESAGEADLAKADLQKARQIRAGLAGQLGSAEPKTALPFPSE